MLMALCGWLMVVGLALCQVTIDFSVYLSKFRILMCKIIFFNNFHKTQLHLKLYHVISLFRNFGVTFLKVRTFQSYFRELRNGTDAEVALIRYPSLFIKIVGTETMVFFLAAFHQRWVIGYNSSISANFEPH